MDTPAGVPTTIATRTRAILIAVDGLVLVGGGAAFVTGFGPAPGGSDAGEQLTDVPTGTPWAPGADSGGTGAEPSAAPFTITIEAIDECGRTCRDVTVSLHNNRDELATAVTVFTRVYAGRDTTEDDDRVWAGREDVGTLEAGGTHMATKRVELSLQDAVESCDGWITVVTTVRSSERTVTFTESQQVT